ncbi:MAG TPA: NUDIX domain-containing protein [Candidatus Dojkabacteria bacterium]|nr:NUDIX domain-containing protein [Candidatus Dojkabacteria bacterium]
MKKEFHYPAMAVDALVTCGLKILLIKRKDNLKYALPGGFLDEGETLFSAALRELREETSLKVDILVFKSRQIFDDPLRDPRGHILTMAHHFTLPDSTPPQIVPATDAKEASWHNIIRVLDDYELYADHKTIIKEVLSNA